MLIREDGLWPEGGKDVGEHSDEVDVKEEEEEEEEEEEADDEEEKDQVGGEEEAEANVVNKSSTQSDILGYYSDNNRSKNQVSYYAEKLCFWYGTLPVHPSPRQTWMADQL